jgi:hypothetical protein
MNQRTELYWAAIKAKLKADGTINWKAFFDERQLKEIYFDRLYATDFAHGTDGHNARLIIARMAALLDEITANVKVGE